MYSAALKDFTDVNILIWTQAACFNTYTAKDETTAIEAKNEDASCIGSENLGIQDTGDYDWLVTGDASHTLPYIIGSALGTDFSRTVRA